MTIHKRIKERREALKLSMEALAERVGVVYQTVQQWEKEVGGTAPKRERLQRVAEALETTAEYLSFGERTGGSTGSARELSEPAKTLVDLITVADSEGLAPEAFSILTATLQRFRGHELARPSRLGIEDPSQ
ncbi:MAG: helix-turn-helix transcriptional regulator [Burkholderia gladioli]